MSSVTKINNVYQSQIKKNHNSAHMLVEECIEVAFFEILKIKNFQEITITEIIKKAGVSRMGFYRNYSCKEDIIKKLVFKCFFECIDEIQKTRKLDFSIIKIIETSLENLKKHSNKVLLLLENNLTFLLFDYYEKAFFSLYQTNKTSRIRQYSIMMFLGELFTLEITWLKNGLIETPKEMARIYYNLLKLKSKQ